MIPVRSQSAKSAKTVFYDHLNDIDIYIEDTKEGSEKFYTKILSKVLGDQYKVEKIFSLGGRNDVITEFNKNKCNLKKPVIHIIDGDLYLLSGDRVATQKGLFVTPFYCIENILIDEPALIKITEEEDKIRNEIEAKNELAFEEWAEKNKILVDLFVEYAVCMVLAPEKETVGYSIYRLTTNENDVVDQGLVNQRIGDIREYVIKTVGRERYSEVYSNVESLIDDSIKNLFKYVSGKDYLFPMIENRIRNLTNSRADSMTLKQRIANICDMSSLKDMVNYILVPE